MRCWRCELPNANGAVTCARCGAPLVPQPPLSATRGMPAVGASASAPGWSSREMSDVHPASPGLSGMPDAVASAPRNVLDSPHNSPAGDSPRGRSTLIVTVALAALLALTGFGAVRAAELLQHAMHILVTPTDLARTTCTAYTTQNYALLTQQIDPTPIPPANSDTFNPAAVSTQLRAIDKIQGATQRCDIGAFDANGTTGQYHFTLRRSQASGAIALVLILREQSDGSWKISRETNFGGTPAP